MALTTHTSTGDIIVSRLEQPHRYDYELHCKCGFQSHGFANATADIEPEARAVAFRHLFNKHRISGTEEIEKHISFLKSPTRGGNTYIDLLRLSALEEEPLPAHTKPGPEFLTASQPGLTQAVVAPKDEAKNEKA